MSVNNIYATKKESKVVFGLPTKRKILICMCYKRSQSTVLASRISDRKRKVYTQLTVLCNSRILPKGDTQSVQHHNIRY